MLRTEGFGPLLEVRMWFCRSTKKGQAWDMMICKDCKDVFHFCVAVLVDETHESDMLGGPGVDFLIGLHFGASDLQVCCCYCQDDMYDRCSALYDLT